jgi:phosphohistidine phosphatase SixA
MAKFALSILLFLMPWVAQAQADEASLWKQIRQGGHVLLIRHAQAPGTFDPPGFKLADCSTQRNLSDEGRAQAKQIGQQIKLNNIPIGLVLSSQWCRCLDTAHLAFGAQRVKPTPALNSPTQQDAALSARHTSLMRDHIAATALPPNKNAANTVLVTHNFNIQDMLGISVEEGEIAIAKADVNEPSQIVVVGRIKLKP